jgi:PAS domain S-box-containing protein
MTDRHEELLSEIEKLKKENKSLKDSIRLLQSPNTRIKNEEIEDFLNTAFGEVPDDLRLSDILNTESVQSLMNDCYDLIKFGIGIIDMEGKILVGTGWQDICVNFHRVNPETTRNCIESDCELSSGVTSGEIKQYRCKNNLWDISTPIYIGNKHIGNIFLGQFIYEDEEIDDEFFRHQARYYGFNEQSYLQALSSVPRWTHAQVKLVMSFYSKLAGILSQLGYKNLLLTKLLYKQREKEEELEKERTHLRSLLMALPDLVWLKDTNGRYLSCNNKFESLLEIPHSDIIGKTDYDFFDKEQADIYHRNDCETIAMGKSCIKEESVVYKDGHQEIIESIKTPIYTLNGELLGVLGIGRNITERKKSEESLKKSLLEKETLLRELYHRTKNNMQVISAMLQIRAMSTEDPVLIEVLNDTSTKINTMALVHQKLYQSGDLSRVNIREYILDLTEYLVKIYNVDIKVINIHFNLSDEFLLIDYAVPFGMVLNELISNSFKYAFPDNLKGDIYLDLSRSDNSEIDFCIRDNGVGLRKDYDINNSDSLGMKLIRTIVEHQLKGTISVKSNNGLNVKIVFKDNLYSSRV